MMIFVYCLISSVRLWHSLRSDLEENGTKSSRRKRLQIKKRRCGRLPEEGTLSKDVAKKRKFDCNYASSIRLIKVYIINCYSKCRAPVQGARARVVAAFLERAIAQVQRFAELYASTVEPLRIVCAIKC